MPVTRVGKRDRTEENNKDGSKEKKQKRGDNKTRVLYEFECIDYKADKWHTLIRCIPEGEIECSKVISRIVCSFLNGSGGILCFGCRSNGRIYGEKISRKEEDNLRLLIDETVKRFHPFISPSHYRINFIPVKSRYSTSSSNYVLEIKVERGDPYELYETEYHEVFLRTAGGDPYGPLTPHEIKRHVLQQYRKKLEGKSNLENILKEKSGKKKAIVRPLTEANNRCDTAKDPPVNKTVPHPLTISQKAALPVCTSGPGSSSNTTDAVQPSTESKNSITLQSTSKPKLCTSGPSSNTTATVQSSTNSITLQSTSKPKVCTSGPSSNTTATVQSTDSKRSFSLQSISKATCKSMSTCKDGFGTNHKTLKSQPSTYAKDSLIGKNHKTAKPSTYAKKSHCPPFILPPPPPPPPPFAYHSGPCFQYPGYQPHSFRYFGGARNHGYYHYN